MDAMNGAQRSVVARFVAASQEDSRVVAAFLGGSYAGGTADEYSDLDIYVVTSDEGFDSFFASRHDFMRRLGETVFAEDFNQFGFNMIIFTFADGVEGELAFERESLFEHIHGGPYSTLVDKKGLLDGKELPLYTLSADEQLKTLRYQIVWFWEDVSNFVKALSRGKNWLAASALDQMRRKSLNLAHLQHDFTAEAGGYAAVDKVLTAEQKALLEATFGGLDTAALLRGAFTVIEFYSHLAPKLAAKHGVEYPAGAERVWRERLALLHNRQASDERFA